MDGWALGSVEPGDPRWALVGDHALDGQAFCLHRHRDDMEWPPRCQRVVNAVIAPLWERIRHYADLQAAQNISLSVVVIYIACRVNTPL